MDLNILDSELLKSVIKTCDLLFITIPENSTKGDLSEAISSSTGKENENCIHVGVLKNEINEEIQVIEANTQEGVICRSLKNFLEINSKINPLKKYYIKRIKSSNEEDIKRWINEVEKQIGKKYNHTYLPSKDSLYCSELIYNSFKDNKNNPLFNQIPMNFKNKEGNYPQYWIELYKKLNMEIPQGKMGTNPHQIMKSEILFNLCEINNNNISYSFYKIENDNEVFNETKNALKESNTDIWTQFEKKIKLNPNFKALGARKYINGEFKEYNYIKISDCFSLAVKIGNGLAYIGLKEKDNIFGINEPKN